MKWVFKQISYTWDHGRKYLIDSMASVLSLASTWGATVAGACFISAELVKQRISIHYSGNILGQGNATLQLTSTPQIEDLPQYAYNEPLNLTHDGRISRYVTDYVQPADLYTYSMIAFFASSFCLLISYALENCTKNNTSKTAEKPKHSLQTQSALFTLKCLRALTSAAAISCLAVFTLPLIYKLFFKNYTSQTYQLDDPQVSVLGSASSIIGDFNVKKTYETSVTLPLPSPPFPIPTSVDSIILNVQGLADFLISIGYKAELTFENSAKLPALAVPPACALLLLNFSLFCKNKIHKLEKGTTKPTKYQIAPLEVVAHSEQEQRMPPADIEAPQPSPRS